MSKDALQEVATNAVVTHINEIIESSSNPDLAKALVCKQGFEIEHAARVFHVPRDEVGRIVDHLLRCDIVTRREYTPTHIEYVRNEAVARNYLGSDVPFGPRKLLERTEISEPLTLQVMTAVIDLVSFHYQKTFQFDDLTALRELREQSHQALEAIRKAEEQNWHEKLSIPRQFSGFPSFVSEKDPTLVEGYNKNRFTLHGKFDSPEEAMRTGFDSANGVFSLNQLSPAYDLVVLEVKKGSKEGNYDLTLKNMYHTVNFVHDALPLSCRQEVRIATGVLQERLEGIFLNSQ